MLFEHPLVRKKEYREVHWLGKRITVPLLGFWKHHQSTFSILWEDYTHNLFAREVYNDRRVVRGRWAARNRQVLDPLLSYRPILTSYYWSTIANFAKHPFRMDWLSIYLWGSGLEISLIWWCWTPYVASRWQIWVADTLSRYMNTFFWTYSTFTLSLAFSWANNAPS